MNATELLTAMAARIRTIPGVAACHYPPPSSLQTSPTVVLFWGGPAGETTIAHNANYQLWTVPVTARILVTAEGNTPREFGRIDALITPLVDAFTVNSDPNALATDLPGLSGHVSAIRAERVLSSLTVAFAGRECYAADVMFSVTFRRRPGDA